jgi:hypothetical protein
MPKTKAPKEWKPSEHQELMLTELFVNERDVCDACDAVGISRQAYYKWFDKSEWVDLYDQSRNKHLKSKLTKIDKSMINEASNGNVPAMTLAYRRAGELTEGVEQPTTIVIDGGLRPKRGSEK